jgi:hypothetical protein
MNAQKFDNLDHLGDDELDKRFTREAIASAIEVHQIHKLPPRQRWLNIIAEYGSAAKAWKSKNDTGYSSGFADLAMAGLYHLTVEYKVLMPQFKRLFSADDRRLAAKLLLQYGWPLERLDDVGCLA